MPTDHDMLKKQFAEAINKVSAENGSNTPDFILAEFLSACLSAFDVASTSREKWYGKSLSIGNGRNSDPTTERDLLRAELANARAEPSLSRTTYSETGEACGKIRCRVQDLERENERLKSERDYEKQSVVNLNGVVADLRKDIDRLQSAPAADDSTRIDMAMQSLGWSSPAIREALRRAFQVTTEIETGATQND